jgi:hypothetical protein
MMSARALIVAVMPAPSPCLSCTWEQAHDPSACSCRAVCPAPEICGRLRSVFAMDAAPGMRLTRRPGDLAATVTSVSRLRRSGILTIATDRGEWRVPGGRVLWREAAAALAA